MIYHWDGPGRVAPDPNTGNGEELWVYNECVCMYSYLHSLNEMYLCTFVSSVSHRPGVLWLLSDAAKDTQAEDVLKRDSEYLGEGILRSKAKSPPY